MEAPRIVPVRVARLDGERARERVLAAEPNRVVETGDEGSIIAWWDDGGMAIISPNPEFPPEAQLIDGTGRILCACENRPPWTAAFESSPLLAWVSAVSWLPDHDPYPPALLVSGTAESLRWALEAWFDHVAQIPGLLASSGETRMLWTRPTAFPFPVAHPGQDPLPEHALIASCWLLVDGARVTGAPVAALLRVRVRQLASDRWCVTVATAVPALREGVIDWLSALLGQVEVINPSVLLGFALPDERQCTLLTPTERQLRQLYYHGLSDNEIAQAVHKDRGTVSNILSDLRRRHLISTRRPR